MMVDGPALGAALKHGFVGIDLRGAEPAANLEVRASSQPVLVGGYVMVGAGSRTIFVIDPMANAVVASLDLGPDVPAPNNLTVVGDELWFNGTANPGGATDLASRFGRITLPALLEPIR